MGLNKYDKNNCEECLYYPECGTYPFERNHHLECNDYVSNEPEEENNEVVQ